MRMTWAKDALTREVAESLLDEVAAEAEPLQWETFLADASGMIEIKHSVVMAAIACEAAVKATLQEAASDEQKELVRIMLHSPRDFSMVARSLFHEPCLAVLGRSPKQDRRDLYKQVDHLFEDRNAIVHGLPANLRDPDTLVEEIDAARDAIAWLRQKPDHERNMAGC